MIRCISPIDGSVYAERPVLSAYAARDAVARTRVAQAARATRPLQERIALVRKAVANVGAMNDEIVPELAHQMGRPIIWALAAAMAGFVPFSTTSTRRWVSRRH